jgi:hypothetical protein
MKVWEVKLAEEEACNLYSFDGCDMLVELEELCALLTEAEEERGTEARKLAVLVVEACNTLMNHGMLPIVEVP